MKLKNEILFSINNSASISELKSILVRFKENGGTKENAHLELYELLQEASSEFEDAMLRELLDFTIGFSGKMPTNWD
jgi:hypothetical protein